MQQTIVLLYAEVTVAMHSFDLKGVIHYRRDFTYSSFQTGERGTCQARGNCSRSGSHGIHIKAALSHRTKGRAYRCNAGACPKGYPAPRKRADAQVVNKKDLPYSKGDLRSGYALVPLEMNSTLRLIPKSFRQSFQRTERRIAGTVFKTVDVCLSNTSYYCELLCVRSRSSRPSMIALMI